MKKLNGFSEYLVQLGRRNNLHKVFTDFLEIIVCSLSLGAMEERYLEIVRNYQKEETYALAEAFGALIIEMDNNGQGLKDCFGDFFMEHLSNDRNGQFFTPEPICEMTARMINPNGFGERVADCCCGSGRMLLAAAKINRNALFFGADVDRSCAMMCVINMCLNGMLGEVAWMNTLSNQFYGGWQVELHPEKHVPYIRKITEEESYIVLKAIEQKKEHKEPLPQQQVLFEF